jgi:hypothetical protein
MLTIIEKCESHWALRFVGDRRDEMRYFQLQIGRATSVRLTVKGFDDILQVVRIVPVGIIHEYKRGWSLTFCTTTKGQARKMQKTILSLIDAYAQSVSHDSSTKLVFGWGKGAAHA